MVNRGQSMFGCLKWYLHVSNESHMVLVIIHAVCQWWIVMVIIQCELVYHQQRLYHQQFFKMSTIFFSLNTSLLTIIMDDNKFIIP